MTNDDVDFFLVYHADGKVELLDADENFLWASDSDDDFLDEFGEEFFSDEEDSDDILEYLQEKGLLDVDTDEIEIIENDLEDESATNVEADVLEAEYTDVTPKRKNGRRKKS